MRRLTVIVAAMMLATLPLSAQEHKRPDYGKNEIGVSYGYLTNNMTVAVFAEVLTLGHSDIDSFYSGGASINYLHYVHPVVGVGAVATYEYGWEPEHAADFHHHYYTLMPQVKIYWFNRKYVAMYSRIGIGATYLHGRRDGVRDTSWRPAFQLSGICLEAGGRVRGFLELALGNMGNLLAGVKVNF